jgi:hypothetical protein
MPRMLTAECSPILFKKDRILFVLIQDVLVDLVTLSFQEITSPTDGWHQIIHSH